MLQTSIVDDIHLITCIPKHISRRITNELLKVKCEYSEIKVTCTEEGNIHIILKRKNNVYGFDIPKDYPFKAPRITINYKNASELYNLKTNRFRRILKYVSGMDCFCCNSYVCSANWCPALTLNKIVEQLEYFKTIKYRIFLKLILDKIKETYLNRYIDLDSWLFNIYDKRLCFPEITI